MEQDANKTKALFSLYRSLVKPFQEFEELLSQKRSLERTAASAQGTISRGYRGTAGEIFVFAVKWAIPFLIAFYVILNVIPLNEEGLPASVQNYRINKLFHLYDAYLTMVTNWAFDRMSSATYNRWISLLTIGAAFLGYVVAPVLFVFFPSVIVGFRIRRKREIMGAKATLKSCEEQLPQVEAAIQEAWKKLTPYIKKIPPNYRNSHALDFFAESYFNFKVKDLMGAVNLYDQYMHQQRMEQGQRQMREENKAAIDALSQQIDNLEEMVASQELIVNNYYYY